MQRRDPLIDALRAFALAGILVVNIQSFVWGAGEPLGYFSDESTDLDVIVHWLLSTFVSGKFIALFAFLVALGAFSPGDAIWATIVVALLCVMWIMHAVMEGRHRDTRDPAVVRARERRGF